MTKAKEIVAAKSPYRPLKWKKNHLAWYYGDFRIRVKGGVHEKGLMVIIDRVHGYAGMTLKYMRVTKMRDVDDAKQFVEVTQTLGVEP